MGISGCEVAKDAADIVILDDNFTSVFRAAQWGRSVYDNIRKFIQFQLTVNIVVIALVFLSAATLGTSPLNVIQLLWINMIMDTLAAIALATEPPPKTELKKDRIRKQDKLILPVMWRNILGQGLYQFLVLVVLLYFGPLMYGERYNYKYYSESLYVGKLPGDAGLNQRNVGDPTARLYHYTLIFHTLILMTLFN